MNIYRRKMVILRRMQEKILGVLYRQKMVILRGLQERILDALCRKKMVVPRGMKESCRIAGRYAHMIEMMMGVGMGL